ncbi:Uncharacterised protein [Vibrio cholerae]|uniref:Uncharacterized protein n=1 Tax=Vibrio cholerae TaxID=666 RepID=A0A655QYY1_VIBCL|nr:Uncharacterised protein [Vibrio cholerae]CSC28600.1 Uncharacterised protein [Vibrio cholerae]
MYCASAAKKPQWPFYCVTCSKAPSQFGAATSSILNLLCWDWWQSPPALVTCTRFFSISKVEKAWQPR